MRPQNLFSLAPSWGISLVVCGGLLTGCAASRPPMSLERARADYLMASNDQSVRANASADLFAAQNLLQQAETNWQEDENFDETTHLAYLTSLKVDLARANAQQKEASKEFQKLSGEQDKIRLEARNAEIRNLQARKVPEGILVTLGDVLFDTARADLKPGSLQKISPLARYLQQHPDTMVKIEGYADSQGPADYNEELSRRRAEAVRSFLVGNGISPDRISVQGMGENFPVASNATAAGRQQNRRVDVTITDMPSASGR